MNARKGIIPLVLYLLFSVCSVAGSDFFFIEYGFLLQVDPENMELSIAGAFHPAAPTVARAPDGLFWARRGERQLAAMDGESGRIAAEVVLPMRPYNHIIAANGKAYVTHHTLTQEEFWVSVVDTWAKKLLEPIKQIVGLRSDLEAGERCVYLATVDVRPPHELYLYAIDTEQDVARILLREVPKDYRFRLACMGDRLYICRTGPIEFAGFIPIEVMDTESGAIVKRIDADRLRPISRITGKMAFSGRYAYLPCTLGQDDPGLARLVLPDLELERVFPMPGAVCTILGFHEDIVVFTSPDNTETGSIVLIFYSLREEREVRRVSIPEFLESKISK
jgi:hypothetical protein